MVIHHGQFSMTLEKGEINKQHKNRRMGLALNPKLTLQWIQVNILNQLLKQSLNVRHTIFQGTYKGCYSYGYST